MSETTIPDLRKVPRADAYDELAGHAGALLRGYNDEIAAMATISSLLHHSLGFLWTGFYRVVNGGSLLRVGPYQGSLGCMEIAYGQGVCGTAAKEKRTIVVPDVSAFPGHIACDARSKSEIVVPVFNGSGDLIAVLDVDSEFSAFFDEVDAKGLEKIVNWFRGARYS